MTIVWNPNYKRRGGDILLRISFLLIKNMYKKINYIYNIIIVFIVLLKKS
jgi:hypothetical protein